MAPIPSSSKGKVGDASGTDEGELTTMPPGEFKPDTSEAFTVAPVMALYSPIVPAPFWPKAKFVTNRFPPDNAMPTGTFNPEEMKELLIVAPVVALYSPIVLAKAFATKRFPPDNAMPNGPFNPEMKAWWIGAPVVALYSPIVLAPVFATKIWARLVTGMRQSAAITMLTRRSVKRARGSERELDVVLVFIGLRLMKDISIP